MKNILITGAAGYIGSVCAYKMLKEGYNITVFDNLSTGHIETINKLRMYGNLDFIQGDLKNIDDIERAFQKDIEAVIHFAAYSLVAESQKYPLKYCQNNIEGSINLFKTMIKHNVKKIVFSSSAAIFGNPVNIPINEEHQKEPINTYGMTKLFTENILKMLDNISQIKSAKLRYFNACGASSDSLFGEWHENETHLIPNILNMKDLKVFGNDYSTPDGTCIRDYIDVEDLASAHILALNYIEKENKSIELNLGTQKGVSVKEIIKACEEVVGKDIQYEVLPRREGDPEILVADNTKAKELINWSPKVTIKESIKKAWEYNKKRCR